MSGSMAARAADQHGTMTDRIRSDGDPAAPDAAVVRLGSVRITVLSARLLRLEWAHDGRFEDRATMAVVNRRTPVPDFTVAERDGVTEIDTGSLVLRHAASGGPFTADNLSIRLTVAGGAVTWRPGISDRDNLRGTRRTLDSTGGPVALEPGILSRAGWAVLDDSHTVLLGEDAWVARRPSGERQDWYFFGHGHDYPAALADWTRISGPVPLVPRFVLGVWWSRYWAYSAGEATALVDDFRRHGLPLDVLVLDMDWHRKGWTGYSWNTELFPDPPAFLRAAHDRGVRVTLNLHPADGVAAHEDAYPAVARALGVDPESEQTIAFRIADRAFAQAYFEYLHHPLENDGVDFWWLDWQQGETSDLDGLDPLPWLNHLHFLDSARRGTRPLTFSRWGGMGNHRYQIGFSGDTFPTWSALAFQPEFTATAANVGYGWWSHDVGGHFGAVEPELYVRWLQFGALSPVFRLHSNDASDAERRPWAFGPQVLAAATAALRLRYELLPYLYTYARVATDTGVSLCRPMYYAYPEADAAYRAPDQYMLGDHLLAAPVTTPADPATGFAAVTVWVPDGVWYDLDTGERHEGTRWVTLAADLDRIPLLARAGSILPRASLPDRGLPAHLGALPDDGLVLRVIPGGNGSFDLYEDDGVTDAYKSGAGERTRISAVWRDPRHLTLRMAPVDGHCPALPGTRRVIVALDFVGAPERVRVNGRDHPRRRVTDRGFTFIDIGERAKGDGTVVEVIWSRPAAEDAGPDAAVRDARHLVPDAGLPNDRRAALARLLDQPATPGWAAAVARLGGPAVQIQPSVRPEQARETLCHLLLVAPEESACDVEVQWRLHDEWGLHTSRETLLGVTNDHILTCPFPAAPDEQPRRWSVLVTVTYGDTSWTTQYHSPVLFPAAGRWTADVPLPALADAAAPRETRMPLGDALRPLDHVHEPRLVPLFRTEPFASELTAGHALRGTFRTTVHSPADRHVLVELHSYGTAACRLNGMNLRDTVDVPVEDVAPLATTWIRYVVSGDMPAEPVRTLLPAVLRTGANELVVHSASPPGNPWWEFSVVLRDLSGSVLTGVRYGDATDAPPHR